MMAKKSIVIIGGGPAGLTAAYELLKDNGSEQYEVTVLEASGEFGGISRTVRHNGNRMDIGGHRFCDELVEDHSSSAECSVLRRQEAESCS